MPVSAVVLNFNGGRMVMECLKSLAEQTPPCHQIICVDNASTDGSLEAVEETFPKVEIVSLPRNQGFAGGMNRGIAASTADVVALINLDVVLEPGYLFLCSAALAADQALGGVTGKLMRPGPTDPPILDSTGHIVYRNRRAVDRGEREPDSGQYDHDIDLFSICGAAPVYRRTMLEDIKLGAEYFDEDFFAYFEDFDLSWRSQLRGWGAGYVPDAVGTHYRGGTGSKASTFILACNHRNRLLVMLRNDHPSSFLRHLPGIAYTEARATLHMFSLRPAALLMAWAQFIRLVPSQLRKRRRIQRARTVSWSELERWFEPYEYGPAAMLRRRRQRAAVR